MAGLELIPLFTVPILRIQMPEHERCAAELRELFLDCESRGAEFRNAIRRDTQKGALFESRFDLFNWTQPAVRHVAEFCHASLSATLAQISNHSEADVAGLQFDYHSWFHVTRKGGFQGRHNHPNASWSGIFCVDPGEESPDLPESGAVLFHDTRENADYYSDAGSEELHTPYAVGPIGIKHREGRLWLFPSYLYHEIFPYWGERPRIVIAFNCWIRRKEAPHA